MNFKLNFKKKQILSAILIIASIISITSLYLIQIEYQERTKNIKIMTWNIHKGIGIDNEYDLDRIVNTIKDKKPDIVGLQEIEENMAAKIADKLNMEYFFGADFEDEEGNAILSKYPIEEIENLYLSPDDERSLIRAEIVINSEIWNIFITHLSLRNREDNLIQIESILSKELKGYTKRVILLGDFNFGPESEQYKKILNNENIELKDTYRYLNEDSGLTFRTNFLFRRIDYIFCSSDLKPTVSEVVYSSASDHCALITTF
jgi:endonuclease/exonuclease/phosphatase family metal-dependent hydrolase